MTNITGSLEWVSSIYDGYDAPELNGANKIAETTIAGTVYLFVTGNYDDGVQVLKLKNSGELEAVQSVADSASVSINNPSDLKVMNVGNKKFLVVSSTYDDTLSVFQIGTGGSTKGFLTYVGAIDGTDIAGYAGTLNNVASIEVLNEGANKAVFAVTATYGDAVATFEIDNSGEISLLDAVFDTEATNLHLDGASAMDSFVVGGTTYLYVASGEDGISVFKANTGNGSLNTVQNYADGRAYNSLAAVNWNGENVLVAAGEGYLDVFRIGGNGSLNFKMRTEDSDAGTYYPRSLETVSLDGVPFLVMADYSSTTIGIYSIEDDYSIVQIDDITDASAYDNALGWVFVEVNGKSYLISTAYDDDGVTVTEIGGEDDYLLGTEGADRIAGLRGDDVLAGKSGADKIFGGAGDDVAVGSQGSDTLYGGGGDDVLVGGLGDDLLSGGGGADILKGGLGTDMISYAGSGGAVAIDLGAGTASGGQADGDYFRGIEDIEGSNGGDTLTGDDGSNRIEGLAGADRISGGGGSDKLFGGAGFDTIWGGNGYDRLDGNNGYDNLYGGAGGDKLNGGGGNDKLFGGEGADTLTGNSGADTLVGGAGNDELTGSGGADVFLFEDGFGDDLITDFDLSKDKLDLSAIDEIESMTDFHALSQTIAGDLYIAIDEQNSIQLAGVTESQLSASNFIF